MSKFLTLNVAMLNPFGNPANLTITKDWMELEVLCALYRVQVPLVDADITIDDDGLRTRLAVSTKDSEISLLFEPGSAMKLAKFLKIGEFSYGDDL